jgi:hypothetical protein
MIFTFPKDVLELCEKLESLCQLYLKRQLLFSDLENRFNNYRPEAIRFMGILKQHDVVTCDEENVMLCGFSEDTAGAVLKKTPELLRRFLDRLSTAIMA